MNPVPVASQASRVPRHVAIIMDGNGRWAAARGLGRTAGHRRGAQSVKTAAESAVRLGVRYLTLFGFSSENWGRPSAEVSELMGLLRHYLEQEVGFLQEHRIRLRVIGDRERFAPDIIRSIERAERDTSLNHALNLTIALSYGGRAEITAAARQLAKDALEGRISLEHVNEDAFSRYLYTADMPDPDLVIRTSGEKRISNFLLWQSAYTELVFIDTMWPDFSVHDFEEAIRDFCQRERRYGSVSA